MLPLVPLVMCLGACNSLPPRPELSLMFILPSGSCEKFGMPKAIDQDWTDLGPVTSEVCKKAKNFVITPEDLIKLKRYLGDLTQWAQANCQNP